jgi:hypothetical protein
MRWTLIAALALLCFRPEARAEQPWVLVTCDPALEGKFAAFEKAVRQAKPGDDLYLPKPFPQTDAEASLDYVYQYRSFHRERMAGSSLPDNEESVLKAVVSGHPRFSVVRVANWTPLHCRGEKRRDFFFLVRIFDGTTGKEVSRAALDASGLISVMVNATDAELAEPASRDALRLPAVEALVGQVSSRYGLTVKTPQYVATFGSVPCPFTQPCLAFRASNAEGTYLFLPQKQELFWFDSRAKRLIDGIDLGTDSLNKSMQESLRPDEALLSLGASDWVRARRILPASAKKPAIR